VEDKTNLSIWTVTYSNRAAKDYKKMPKGVQLQLDLLTLEIEKIGPIRKIGHTLAE